MKIISWNVNGIVACRRKGFLRFLADTKPDVVCCQEIKTKCALNTPGYHQFWNLAQRPGYSGTLVLAKQPPLSWSTGFGSSKFDEEGRLITLEYADYYIVNVYVPSVHPHNSPDRPDFRLEWDEALREYIARLPKPVVLCGDFNVTHAYIDSYPENGKNEPDDPLFRSEVRDGFDKLLATGVVDAFRVLNPNKAGAYTWWGPKNKNRAENRGSRLDYFLVSGELLSFVQSIRFHKDILASDHCPISMLFYPVKPKREIDDADMAAIWGSIDWDRLQGILLLLQQDLAYAAYNREWDKVDQLQRQLVGSWAARALAVREVLNGSNSPGVDGVRWTTDAQKARAAQSLIARGYRPLPYLYRELEEHRKVRINLIPTMRDRAMQILYSFALDPVAESTADKKSFFARKGRSPLDPNAHLLHDLTMENAPTWVVIADVQTFYATVAHDWLIENIPMDKTVLQKFLKAGMVRNGELFPTDKGMSMASALSPKLGNMMLDGLQSYIYDRLYPSGGVDYPNGNLNRLLDDMVITARDRTQAELIMQIVEEFLACRGLRLHPEKSYITNVYEGFDYVGRHYQFKYGCLSVKPAESSIIQFEAELKNLIMNFSGTQRDLIKEVNWKLAGWGHYHRTEDAYMDFRHIDSVVEGLLVKKMCMKYPRWHRKTVLNKFWLRDGWNYVFVLPADHSVRVNRLAPLPIMRHKPCRLNFNPYLDQDYQIYLQHRRNIQKSNGKYRGVWTRQSGRCAYCGARMLADQEVELVEKNLGQGWSARNLQYVHRQCGYQVQFGGGEVNGEHIDLFSILEGFENHTPDDDSPYIELTEYFRKNKQPVICLKFQEIERILGDRLLWEAYCFEAFWYDDTQELSSPMWRSEEFPFHKFLFSEQSFNITHSWLSQGYKIKALHLETGQVTFRREDKNASGVVLPKALTSQRLPEEVVYKFNKMVQQFAKDYGLI